MTDHDVLTKTSQKGLHGNYECDLHVFLRIAIKYLLMNHNYV